MQIALRMLVRCGSIQPHFSAADNPVKGEMHQ